MTWLKRLTGCPEESLDRVHADLEIDGPRLRSRRNGQSWLYGTLETPTLATLRERAAAASQSSSGLSVREVIANVQHLHIDGRNANALFQVASQFNLLEMVSPNVSPDDGVGRYEHDRTQGPACGILQPNTPVDTSHGLPMKVRRARSTIAACLARRAGSG